MTWLPLHLIADFPPSLWNGLTDSQGNVNVDSLSAISILIANIIQIAISLAGLLAVAFIIVGGIQYITSNGNPQGIEKAKTTLTNAIVGVVLVAAAYTIVGYVAGLFNS